MNRLFLARGYLCGAMDRVLDGGVEWRQRLKEDLADLNVCWLDPTDKPIDIGIEDLESREMRKHAKRIGDFDAVRDDMKIIRHVDLRMVDICDFMVVNLDMNIHASGTYEELFWANRMKKPIIVRVAQGKDSAPDWLYGTLPHQMIFGQWFCVYKYLRHIAQDSEVDHLGRWLFFDFQKVIDDNKAYLEKQKGI